MNDFKPFDVIIRVTTQDECETLLNILKGASPTIFNTVIEDIENRTSEKEISLREKIKRLF